MTLNKKTVQIENLRQQVNMEKQVNCELFKELDISKHDIDIQNVSRLSHTSYVDIMDEHVKFLIIQRDELFKEKEEILIQKNLK